MTDRVSITTRNVKETMDFGFSIGEKAEDGLFLALSGDLGTGKTHFVQGLARGLGIQGPVTSPTFTIMNLYDDGRLPLKHFDFYRMNTEDDLWNIGWEEYSSGGVTVVEWADLFPHLMPQEAVAIQFQFIDPETRRLLISWNEKGPQKLIKEIQSYAASH